MLSRATIYRSSTKARSTRRTSNTPVQRPNRSAPRPPSPPPSTHLHLSKCSKHVSGVDSHAGSTIHTRRAADTRFGDCAPAATKLEAVEDERKIAEARSCSTCRRAWRNSMRASDLQRTSMHTVNIRCRERARRQVGGGLTGPDSSQDAAFVRGHSEFGAVSSRGARRHTEDQICGQAAGGHVR